MAEDIDLDKWSEIHLFQDKKTKTYTYFYNIVGDNFNVYYFKAKSAKGNESHRVIKDDELKSLTPYITVNINKFFFFQIGYPKT